MKMKVKLDPGAYMPERAHSKDAGLDLKAPKGFIVYPKKKIKINTGVHVQLPPDTDAYVKNRSSFFDEGLLTDGTIDEGYTGAIIVEFWNITDKPFVIKRGHKIAQLVIHPIIKPECELVDELEETERGTGGFGSTGK